MIRKAFTLVAATAVALAAAVDASDMRPAMMSPLQLEALSLQMKKPTLLNSGLACPSYDEMQSERVRSSFDVRKMQGFFYEL